MQLFELTIYTCEWFGQNFAHNLDFIPDDKLDWKPTPTAKSALEIAGEVVGVFQNIQSRFEAPDSQWKDQFPHPASRDEAKEMVLSASKSYADFLRGLTPADLEGNIDLPFGPMPKLLLAQIPVRDLNHHHGQITYLQTIWGDKQSHFFQFGS